jgi:hypothetical protein
VDLVEEIARLRGIRHFVRSRESVPAGDRSRSSRPRDRKARA